MFSMLAVQLATFKAWLKTLDHCNDDITCITMPSAEPEHGFSCVEIKDPMLFLYTQKAYFGQIVHTSSGLVAGLGRSCE